MKKSTKAILCKRSRGLYTTENIVTLPLPLSHYARKLPKSYNEYVVREEVLLEDLVKNFMGKLDAMLKIRGTGQKNLKLFKNWSNAGDCYCLELVED